MNDLTLDQVEQMHDALTEMKREIQKAKRRG